MNTATSNRRLRGMLAGLSGAALISATALSNPAMAGTILCGGQTPTIVAEGSPTLGTEGDDVILGTRSNERIDGGGGDDIICGRDGSDYINGGDGNDFLEGGSGRESLNGENGNDHLIGGAERDALKGAEGNDTLDGGKARDFTLTVEPGNDHYAAEPNETLRLFAGGSPPLPEEEGFLVDLQRGVIEAPDGAIDTVAGTRIITGTPARDTFIGGPLDDVFMSYSGGGSDTFAGGLGNDSFFFYDIGEPGVTELRDIDGGPGPLDRVELWQDEALDVDLSQNRFSVGSLSAAITNVEWVHGRTEGSLKLRGDDGANILSGTALYSADRGGALPLQIRGLGGDDVIYSANDVNSDDFFDGGSGDDVFQGCDFVSTNVAPGMQECARQGNPYGQGLYIDLAEGILSVGRFAEHGYIENVENVSSYHPDDLVLGTDGPNVIEVHRGAVVRARGGDDQLFQTYGHASFHGGAGEDTLSWALVPNRYLAPLEADLSTGRASSAFRQHASTEIVITTRMFEIENLVGSSATDLLSGGSLANSLSGGPGDDTLDGRDGIDELNGGEGSDSCANGESLLDCES